MKSGRLDILLVDDDENDVFMVQKATARSGAGHTIQAVRDGEEAICYLRGVGQYADRQKFPLPNVIVTDLKMQRVSGFDFLRWLRSHPECGVIPALVFTSSRMDQDILEAYKLGANSFLTKPVSLEGLVELLRITYEYWSRCECPPTPGNCT
jgi:CheY-like chemotaxis protein